MKVDVTISILVKKRRNDKVLVSEMFYIDLVVISAFYLIDHIDHVLQLLL